MKVTDIWKKAAKENLKIETSKGSVSFLTLWTMPIESALGTSLSAVYEEYQEKLKKKSKLSLTKRTKSDPTAELIVALVEDVYETRIAERDAEKNRKAIKEKLAVLEELKEQKELEALKGKDTKDIDKEIAELRKAL